MEGWDLMKKCLALTVFLVLMIVLYGCSNEEQAASQETVTLQLGHALSPGTPASDNIDELAQVIEEKTEGRVKFEIYGNGQLDPKLKCWNRCRSAPCRPGRSWWVPCSIST